MFQSWSHYILRQCTNILHLYISNKTIIVIKGCHFAAKVGYISLIDWCLTPTLAVFKQYCDVGCISEKKFARYILLVYTIGVIATFV